MIAAAASDDAVPSLRELRDAEERAATAAANAMRDLIRVASTPPPPPPADED